MKKTLHHVRCRGDSMQPLLPSGAIVLTKRIKTDEYRFGDIVWMSQSGKSVVHRIIRVEKDKVLLKGDRSKRVDGWFNKKLIKAKAIGYIYNKKIIHWESAGGRLLNLFLAYGSITTLFIPVLLVPMVQFGSLKIMRKIVRKLLFI